MSKENHILYIGLNGYAGSGKDTVAKMLFHILNNTSSSKDEVYQDWKQSSHKYKYATFEFPKHPACRCTCMAFADPLKKVSSSIFAIDLDRFYNSKANGYINISKDFEYVETKPQHNIITAEEYYSGGPASYQNSSEDYWMSIREVLVYVGTYMLQNDINKNVFINILRNNVKRLIQRYPSYQYVICTDVRFPQEIEFVRGHKGIMINIVRDNVEILLNKAEHSIENSQDEYDIVVENNGTLEELFDQLWDIVHTYSIFKNEVVRLMSHDGSDNFLRLVRGNDSGRLKIYELCTEYGVVRVRHETPDTLFMVDPSGGPALYIGSTVDGIDGYEITKIVTVTEPQLSIFIHFVKPSFID